MIASKPSDVKSYFQVNMHTLYEKIIDKNIFSVSGNDIDQKYKTVHSVLYTLHVDCYAGMLP